MLGHGRIQNEKDIRAVEMVCLPEQQQSGDFLQRPQTQLSAGEQVWTAEHVAYGLDHAALIISISENRAVFDAG